MANPRSVLVVGGGIVGLSIALSLQARGFLVTVLDDAPARPPASFGNVGHIATEQVAPLASWGQVLDMPRRLMTFGGPVSFPLGGVGEWMPFGLRLLAAGTPTRFAHGKAALTGLLTLALDAWRARIAAIGGGHLLREGGHVVAWETAASAARGKAAVAASPIPGIACHDLTDRHREVLAGTIRAPIAGAVRYEGTASVTDPGAVLDAFRAAFVAGGGTVQTVAVLPEDLVAWGADIIVVAAGVRSGALMRPLGHRVPIIAERGYHIRSTKAVWPADMPPVVFDDRAVVVSGSDMGVRATSFVEFTKHDAPPDRRKWQRLKQHVAELGLDFGDDVATWHGSRPTLPDYLPAIGRSRHAGNVLYAFGHQHLGLTLGPITGEIVAALAVGDRPPVDIAPFSLDRF